MRMAIYDMRKPGGLSRLARMLTSLDGGLCDCGSIQKLGIEFFSKTAHRFIAYGPEGLSFSV
jgi:hypothetical protein